MSVLDRILRSTSTQKSIIKVIGAVGVASQLVPELSLILFPKKNLFHANLDIKEIPDYFREEFNILCKKSGIDPESIHLTTWNRPDYKFFGGSMFYKLFGLKSYMCIPAVYFSTYGQRHSAKTSTDLVFVPVAWDSLEGKNIEIFLLPNIQEMKFSISNLLFSHKSNFWIISNVIASLLYLQTIFGTANFLIRREFIIAMIPISLFMGVYIQALSYALLSRLEKYLGDSFVIKKFPELIRYGQYRCFNYLLGVISCHSEDHSPSPYEKVYYESFSFSKLPTLNRIRRFSKYIDNN